MIQTDRIPTNSKSNTSYDDSNLRPRCEGSFNGDVKMILSERIEYASVVDFNMTEPILIKIRHSIHISVVHNKLAIVSETHGGRPNQWGLALKSGEWDAGCGLVIDIC
ncbi:hypothetical protein AVEN_268482-1 [Araneus ventricosus]|uniref:Uncharacterized protein n=1 Tax=Araneus ventricosus TaxID=182803 RepID=A0A4Y2L463_ARAVE|nr:hypothetical protein AVEN_268482-1 [Araneus ventricosus]